MPIVLGMCSCEHVACVQPCDRVAFSRARLHGTTHVCPFMHFHFRAGRPLVRLCISPHSAAPAPHAAAAAPGAALWRGGAALRGARRGGRARLGRHLLRVRLVRGLLSRGGRDGRLGRADPALQGALQSRPLGWGWGTTLPYLGPWGTAAHSSARSILAQLAWAHIRASGASEKIRTAALDLQGCIGKHLAVSIQHCVSSRAIS